MGKKGTWSLGSYIVTNQVECEFCAYLPNSCPLAKKLHSFMVANVISDFSRFNRTRFSISEIQNLT